MKGKHILHKKEKDKESKKNGKVLPVAEEKKVFGIALDKSCTEIPHIMEACVTYLDSTGLDFEGIFRKSGSLNMINDYKGRFERGEAVDFAELLDPHVAAGLLKMYIRDYPEPLLTFELYDCFLAAVAIPDVATKVPKVRQVLAMLPPANLMVVKFLVSFLCRVSAKSEHNMMTPSNLAIVFAPNLLRPPYEGDKGLGIMMEDTPYANELLQLFINHYDELFKEFETKKPQPKIYAVSSGSPQTRTPVIITTVDNHNNNTTTNGNSPNTTPTASPTVNNHVNNHTSPDINNHSTTPTSPTVNNSSPATNHTREHSNSSSPEPEKSTDSPPRDKRVLNSPARKSAKPLPRIPNSATAANGETKHPPRALPVTPTTNVRALAAAIGSK